MYDETKKTRNTSEAGVCRIVPMLSIRCRPEVYRSNAEGEVSESNACKRGISDAQEATQKSTENK